MTAFVIIFAGEFGVVYRGHLINDEDNTTQTIAIKTVRCKLHYSQGQLRELSVGGDEWTNSR